jgi:hypothetical protein
MFCLLLACTNNDLPSCGCNAPPIEEAVGWKGNLFYSKEMKHYAIQIGVPGLYSDYVICNQTLSKLQSIVSTPQANGYSVSFSGKITRFCVSDTIAGFTNNVYSITLSGIKTQ